MRIEVGLSNLQDDARTNHPVIRISAQVEEGDKVTPGSMYTKEVSLESLGNFLGAVRDDQAEGLVPNDVAEAEVHSVDDGQELLREEANELNAEDKAEEDEAKADAKADAEKEQAKVQRSSRKSKSNTQ